MTRGVAILVAILLLAATSAASGEGFVERRGGVDPLVGVIEQLDDAGVHVRTAGGKVVVPWDRVRRVRSDRPMPGLDARMATAESMWRARIRVERGDTALAEPLLETLFERTIGGVHEPALVVAEGLLRCRIARGAHEEAVIPALECLRLERAGIRSSSYDALPPAVDPEAGLCPVLAPFFAAPRRAARLVRDLDTYDAGGDPVVAAHAAAYRRAAQVAAGLDAAGQAVDRDPAVDDETPPAGAPDAPGVEGAGAATEWLDDLVLLARDDRSARAARQAAVERVRRGLADAPRWRQAWSQYALGLARIHEAGEDRRETGALDLLHVPARFGREQPYLAGLALAHAASTLADLGDASGAAALTEALAERWPTHPARALLSAARPERGP